MQGGERWASAQAHSGSMTFQVAQGERKPPWGALRSLQGPDAAEACRPAAR